MNNKINIKFNLNKYGEDVSLEDKIYFTVASSKSLRYYGCRELRYWSSKLVELIKEDNKEELIKNLELFKTLDDIFQVLKNENIVEFNNELYTLNDLDHIEGYLTYSHVGAENNRIFIKCFTITLNTLAWVLTIRPIPELDYDENTKTLNIID